MFARPNRYVFKVSSVKLQWGKPPLDGYGPSVISLGLALMSYVPPTPTKKVDDVPCGCRPAIPCLMSWLSALEALTADSWIQTTGAHSGQLRRYL